MNIFSFGGGVQSTAALILAAAGRISFSTFVFANVGDDSENPATLKYVREIAMPYALEHGLEIHEIRRQTHGEETLYQRLQRDEKSIRIPVYMANGAPGRRGCTNDYKRAVIKRWLGKGEHTIGLGISLDEYQRIRSNSGYPNITNAYPLIDLRLTRADCIGIIKDAGMRIPPKSSCWFCPFHRLGEWQEMRRKTPQLFQEAIELEELLNNKRAELGLDRVYLSSNLKPLKRATADQLPLFEDEQSCESGYCMV